MEYIGFNMMKWNEDDDAFDGVELNYRDDCLCWSAIAAEVL